MRESQTGKIKAGGLNVDWGLKKQMKEMKEKKKFHLGLHKGFPCIFPLLQTLHLLLP